MKEIQYAPYLAQPRPGIQHSRPSKPGWHDGGVGIPDEAVSIAKTVVLFVLAAAAEIGGAWLVWQSVREGKDWWWAGLGVIALGAYGFVATFQPDAHFGRILAAYGGVFVAWYIAM